MATSFCHIHEKQEELASEPYQVCFECGHVYNTAEELVAAYNEAVRVNFGADNPPPPREAHEIFFCQECLHDFV